MDSEVWKKTRKIIITVVSLMILLAMCLSKNIQIQAETKVFEYDSTTNSISGEFITSGEDNIVRLEFYCTSGYNMDNNVQMFDQTNQNYVKLQNNEAVIQGKLSHDAQVVYGGTVPLADYNMNCII